VYIQMAQIKYIVFISSYLLSAIDSSFSKQQSRQNKK